MQNTVNSIVVKGDLAKVYEVAESKGKFSEFVPHILESREFEEEGKTYVSMTAVMKTGSKSRWTSLVVERKKNESARYVQHKGFCRTMGGEWRFTPVEDGVRITLTHQFDVGHPILKLIALPFVNLDNLVKECVEENSQKMLEAIRRRVHALQDRRIS